MHCYLYFDDILHGQTFGAFCDVGLHRQTIQIRTGFGKMDMGIMRGFRSEIGHNLQGYVSPFGPFLWGYSSILLSAILRSAMLYTYKEINGSVVVTVVVQFI